MLSSDLRGVGLIVKKEDAFFSIPKNSKPKSKFITSFQEPFCVTDYYAQTQIRRTKRQDVRKF